MNELCVISQLACLFSAITLANFTTFQRESDLNDRHLKACENKH